MKLIKWNLHEDVEAYTTTRKLGDISLNNPNYLKVLENRQELASLLNTDLEHMVAPRQTHSTNLKQVFLMKDGGTNMLKQTDDLYEVDATYTKDKDLSHGSPACFTLVSGEAPVPPSWPLTTTTSAWAFTTPAATAPMPTSETSLTETRASGLELRRS